jgi:hypothetical protein
MIMGMALQRDYEETAGYAGRGHLSLVIGHWSLVTGHSPGAVVQAVVRK